MLTLPIKKKWYDMILSGEKKEEYREIKPYYDARLPINFGYFKSSDELIAGKSFINGKSVEANHICEVMFRNGYSKQSPSFIAECTLSIGEGKPEWGADSGKKYYVLQIKKVRSLEK